MYVSNDEIAELVLRMSNENHVPAPDERLLLDAVEELGLDDKDFKSLSCLKEAPNLRALYLNKTKIGSLDGLDKLTSLQALYLSEMKLDSLEKLRDLKNLQKLSLNGCGVGSWDGLDKLTSLQALDLSETQFNSLKILGGLTSLRALYLRKTPITSLEGLDGLTGLQKLDLRNTKISSLEPLSKIEKLKFLYISGTSLDCIPKRFVDRKFHFVTDAETGVEPGVYMKDVKLSKQPDCLFAQAPELIKKYYEKEQERKCVNEVKVIFLGDGGVGKTHSINRMTRGEEGTNIITTPGVSITQCCRNGRATINFWDFGGQEIMYSMHRFFLTERTCYVVVVSNRWSDLMRSARFWLKNVASFAPNSKVILAVNRWEGVSAWELDRGRLAREFPQLVVDIVEYTATEPNDVEILKRRIERQVDKLPGAKMELPTTWANIMDKIRNMNNGAGKRLNYISRRTYRRICDEEGITDDQISLWLLEWLNDLGVCFSYHRNEDGSALSNYMLLNPEWLTNAVYIIVNNGGAFAVKGRISRKNLLTVLNESRTRVCPGLSYTQEELDFVLQVMRKFRLSYDVGDDYEFVPVLCQNNMPDGLTPDKYESRVRCEIRYDNFLPDSVAHRLMVDCFGPLNPDKCWRKGLCVDSREFMGLVAVCDMGKADDVLYIDVYQIEDSASTTARKLLRWLLNRIETINVESGLKSTTWICSDDDRKAKFQLSTLFKALERGEKEIQYTADGDFTTYNIQELLGQVIDEPFKFTRDVCDEADRSKVCEHYADKRSRMYLKENSFLNNINLSSRSSGAYDAINNQINEAVKETFESPEVFADLVLFMRKVQDSDLTDEQKETLSLAVERLCNERDSSKKRQRKKELRETINSYGSRTKTIVDFAASAVGVLRFIFGI